MKYEKSLAESLRKGSQAAGEWHRGRGFFSPKDPDGNDADLLLMAYLGSLTPTEVSTFRSGKAHYVSHGAPERVAAEITAGLSERFPQLFLRLASTPNLLRLFREMTGLKAVKGVSVFYALSMLNDTINALAVSQIVEVLLKDKL